MDSKQVSTVYFNRIFVPVLVGVLVLIGIFVIITTPPGLNLEEPVKNIVQMGGALIKVLKRSF